MDKSIIISHRSYHLMFLLMKGQYTFNVLIMTFIPCVPFSPGDPLSPLNPIGPSGPCG